MNKNLIKVIIVIVLLAILSTLAIVVLNSNFSEEIQVIKNEGYIDKTASGSSGKLPSSTTLFESIIPEPSGDLKVYFFDVGQADAIFVQNNDSTMLIDAGNNPDGKYISKFLRNKLKINKIDYLIGSHPHEDHIGGLDIILQDFEIGTFYMPDREVEYKSYTDVIKYATEKKINIISPSVGTKFRVGTALCEIMTKNDDAEEINDTSIAIQLTFGKNKFLFTGDMLETEEKSRTWNDIDVLKVSHHGSRHSSKQSFLEQVKPEIAVIMCGKDNEYGYPQKDVLDRLAENNCNEIYITSEKGTILMTSNGNEITTECLPELDFDGNK